MTLQELKAKATAAELCLINQVDDLVRTDEEKRVIKLTLEFIGKRPPPSIEDKRFDSDAGPKWFKEFQGYFINEQKTQAPPR